ncbi:MAG: hypothetical protein MdMp014T_2744 [Treponematales bacterium]
MVEFDYKCVPVPETIFTGKAGKDSHNAAVTAHENIIKDAAKGGWELDMADTIESFQKAGCIREILLFIPIIGPLIGKEDESTSYKLLIFKKQLS